MADKIVQLVDDQNNNIYPISRGVAADSVDTNAIQDGAVTSDKIDWSTLTSKTINATTTNTKVQNLNVKLVYNDAGFGIISGTFKMVGDFDYKYPKQNIPKQRHYRWHIQKC